MEILKTEETYKTSLVTIFSLYMIQCKRRIGELISKEEFDLLFGGIHEFIPIHKRLHEQLEQRITAAGTDVANVIISDIFLAIADEFLRYSTFINSFDRRLKLLQDLQNRKDRKFAQFLTETMKDDHMKNMDLPAFLIQPVQRLPRYELLLRELCKFTPNTHVDYKNLEEALLKVKETNAQINQLKRDEENRMKIAEIQSQIYCESGVPQPDLCDNPARIYVRSGDINYLSLTRATPSIASPWKRKGLYKKGPLPRNALVFDDQILITTQEAKGKASRYLLHQTLTLNRFKITATAATEVKSKHASETFTLGITFTSEDALTLHIIFLPTSSEQSTWLNLLLNLQ